MKPFSKYEAIGNGKPVVTRDGRKVTQLKEFDTIDPFQVVGVVEGSKGITSWTDDGSYWADTEVSSEMDLFMESVVKEGWIAFGPEENQTTYGVVAFATHVWPTKAGAVGSYKTANNGREPKGTAKILWEE